MKNSMQLSAEFLDETEDAYIYYIRNQEGAELYGDATEWCIADEDNNCWDEYSKDYFFVYLLSKYDNTKYAYIFETKSFLQGKPVWRIFKADDTIANNTYLTKKYGVSVLNIINLIKKDKGILKELSLKSENFLMEEHLSKNSDGTYDVIKPNSLSENTFKVPGSLLDSKGKLTIKFKKSHCTFLASPFMTSLKGCPETVEGSFFCSNNNFITSLKGGPKVLTPKWGDYGCFECANLKSLEGAPEKTLGSFRAYDNFNLETLKGSPKDVGGVFSCSRCKKLTSLEGGPEHVASTYFAYDCTSLVSVKGIAKVIGVGLDLSNDYKLKDLDALKDIDVEGKVYLPRKLKYTNKEVESDKFYHLDIEFKY